MKYFSRLQILLLVFCWGLGTNALHAQSFHLKIQGKDSVLFVQLSGIPLEYSQASECREALFEARKKLIAQSYLLAETDSLLFTENEATVTVRTGPSFRWASLHKGNVPDLIWQECGPDKNQLHASESSMKVVAYWFEKIIRCLENRGYPFARIWLDSVHIREQNLEAAMMLEKGPLIHIDTLIIGDEVQLSEKFIQRWCGIQQGDLYNESKFKQADKRLRELPFMELAYPCRMDFSLDKSKWYVYLKNKNANRADVLLGLLPANESRDGKLLFTGDVKLGFQNALGYGENLNLNWQNLQYRSPRYHVSGEWPFVLNTPIGISARFDFYKRDTLFRNTEAELGVLLQNGSGNMMKLYYKGGSNRLLSVSVPTLIYSRRLPENGDVKTRSMGLENTWSHLDYKPNPRRGHRFYLNLQVAFREILKNNTIESTTDPVTEVPFTYLYDSIKLRTQQYLVRVRAEKFIPLHKRMTMAMSYQGGITYSSESFFRNELFQIGGFRLLRGFDEGALFVNQYHVCSVEPRLALGRNSYVFLFTDQAWLQIQTRLNQSRGWYYSAGAGMVFETRAGLLNLAYALGATPDEGMQFRRAKIHFGYAGTF